MTGEVSSIEFGPALHEATVEEMELIGMTQTCVSGAYDSQGRQTMILRLLALHYWFSSKG